MFESVVIVILGHTNNLTGQLSEVACARLDKGLEVFHQNPGAKILLTGGFGEHFNQTTQPHASYSKAYLVKKGVSESDFIEPFVLSANTIEDGEKSKLIIDQFGASALILVTSDFHMARAKFIFKKQFSGIDITTISAESPLSEADLKEASAHEAKQLLKLQSFETQRLDLRPINHSDGDWFEALWGNPAVVSQIYHGATLNKVQAKAKHQGFIEHWKQHQFGCWIVLNKETKERLGYCGFRYFESDLAELDNTIELGYVFDKPAWGKGYATEAVQKAVQIGIEVFHFESIKATVGLNNMGSRRVLEKAGFTHLKNVCVYGAECCLYGKQK